MKLDEIVIVAAIVLLGGLFVYKHWFSGSRKPVEEQQLNIDNLISKVRDELTKADLKLRASNQASMFELDEFVLELNFVVKSATSANAGLTTELIAVGAEQQYANEQVQKITLKMSIPEAKRDTLARGVVERRKPLGP
jgi:Trypsin-co-occurring domain 2